MSQMVLSEYCQDINRLECGRLIEQFHRLQQNADSVKRMIREKVTACRNALHEQYAIVFTDMRPDRQPVAAPATEIQPNPDSHVL
jgi:mannose/cellobiose epimerase-like protein (N-acyl-D-glucosamine 2-epimerase family)